MSQTRERSKRPVGRPRADGRDHLTTDALLKCTAKLIARNGYTGTSFRMIATELDVSTASIFHRYSSKDELLNALISHAAKASLEFYGELDAISAPAAVKLFKSIVEEVKAVSSVDRDYVAIFYLPELRRPEFSAAQRVREEMVDHYRQLLRNGVDDGSLIVENENWCAEQVFQLTETNILARESIEESQIEERALETARFCLRGVLKNHLDLEAVQAAAADIGVRITVG